MKKEFIDKNASEAQEQIGIPATLPLQGSGGQEKGRIGSTAAITSENRNVLGNTQPIPSGSTGIGIGATQPISPAHAGTVSAIGVTQPIVPKHSGTVEAIGRTVPVALQSRVGNATTAEKENQRPFVGWLVCTSGSQKHQEFRLYDGYNYIGGSMEADVYLEDDSVECINKIAVIGYDSYSRSFSIGLCGSHVAVRVNDRMIMEATQLSLYDTLSIGKSTFIFVPLCGDKFGWN